MLDATSGLQESSRPESTSSTAPRAGRRRFVALGPVVRVVRQVLPILLALPLGQQASGQDSRAVVNAPSAGRPVDADEPVNAAAGRRAPANAAPVNAANAVPVDADAPVSDVSDLPPEPKPARAAKWTPPPPTPAWVAPTADQAKDVNAKAKTPVRVRIGLRLTPFKKVVTQARDGAATTRFVPLEPLRHTLRAQLNKVNHFFVGDYHVETQPLSWVRQSRRYQVRLKVYRRYGAFGQLEEMVGNADLSGVLEEQEANVFVLLGVARQRLRDKFQNPVLDIVAGYTPGGLREGPTVSQGGGQRQRVEAPPQADGAILRGRF
jgi:hypothetical protein